MAHENANGLSDVQWRQILRQVSWARFALTILASSASFAAIGGIYITTVDHRIEKNQAHLERVDAALTTHSSKIAGMSASQAATETAAARLEERLTAQGRTLNRIESLLETLLNENYRRQDPFPRRPPNIEEEP